MRLLPRCTFMYASIICIVHKHYIEHLLNFCYNFIEENYVRMIIVIVLAPSPNCHQLLSATTYIYHIYCFT